ncbi:MAG: hypothetical protein AAGA26_08705, partial [Pseudomonadota bacterium]
MKPTKTRAYPAYGLATLIALSVALPAGGGYAQAINQFLRDREAEIEGARPLDQPAPIEVPRTSVVAPPGSEDVALNLQSIQ